MRIKPFTPSFFVKRRINRAKKVVIDAMNGDNPHELMLYLDTTGRELDRAIGNKHQGQIKPEMRIFLQAFEPATALHAHPQRADKKTYPLSLSDLNHVVSIGIPRVTAYDVNGRFSTMVIPKKRIGFLRENMPEIRQNWLDFCVRETGLDKKAMKSLDAGQLDREMRRRADKDRTFPAKINYLLMNLAELCGLKYKCNFKF